LNRIEGVSIENTSTLKSFGYGRIPSGNYHVIKSERGAPSADFLSPHDADSDAFDEAEARVADTEGDLEERNTLLSQMGPLTRYAGEVLHAASLAEEDGDDLAFDAADQHIRDTVEYHANRFGIKDPAEIDRLHEIVGGEQFMGRKSIIRDIVSEVLKSMGIQKKNTKLASTARELSNRFNELSQEQALKSVVESVVRGVLKASELRNLRTLSPAQLANRTGSEPGAPGQEIMDEVAGPLAGDLNPDNPEHLKLMAGAAGVTETGGARRESRLENLVAATIQRLGNTADRSADINRGDNEQQRRPPMDAGRTGL
jgi:hypothetical protein